jgi:hypothetical protein
VIAARRRPTALACALVVAALAVPSLGSAPAATADETRDDTVCGVRAGARLTPTGPAAWQPVTASRWRIDGDTLAMTAPGTRRAGPVRPYEHAVLVDGPRLGAVRVEAEVRIDTPVTVRDRDVAVLLGYRSDVRYAYVHLSQDPHSSNHNGIFLVDGADRVRIDDQRGTAPPAIEDTDWHAVAVTHCPATGRIEVAIDGASAPLLTATDRRVGAGRVGFGSFDNVGRFRAVDVQGGAATTTPCPPGVPEGFGDDDGSPHERAIDCAAHHGLVRGFGDGTFRPHRPVTRGQFATIVAGTIEASSGVLPGETDRFPDVVGSPHATAIERLAVAGVAGGYRDGTFGAGDPITRAQAASLVDRAVTHTLRSPLPDGPARFGDVGGTHAGAVHRLASAEVIAGTGPTSFAPDRQLTRGQAASLAVRAWELLEDRDLTG